MDPEVADALPWLSPREAPSRMSNTVASRLHLSQLQKIPSFTLCKSVFMHIWLLFFSNDTGRPNITPDEKNGEPWGLELVRSSQGAA